MEPARRRRSATPTWRCWFTRTRGGHGGDAAWRRHEWTSSDGEWLLNPGSVGQPRDGDPRAAWLALDLESWTADWRRVEYPITRPRVQSRAAGLPAAASGERLYIGQ